MLWCLALDSLELNGKLMELDTKNGKLRVNYGDRLVTLLREVRTLTSLGYPIPAKIQHTANVGQKFYRHGVILKQVILRVPYFGGNFVPPIRCILQILHENDISITGRTFLQHN